MNIFLVLILHSYPAHRDPFLDPGNGGLLAVFILYDLRMDPDIAVRSSEILKRFKKLLAIQCQAPRVIPYSVKTFTFRKDMVPGLTFLVPEADCELNAERFQVNLLVRLQPEISSPVAKDKILVFLSRQPDGVLTDFCGFTAGNVDPDGQRGGQAG